MFDRLAELYGNLLASWVGVVRRNAWATVVLCFAATVAAAVFALSDLRINTSSSGLISDDVHYRQVEIAFDAAFPQLDGPLLVVIDGGTAEATDAAARTLTQAMQGRDDLFRYVYEPASDQFFRQNGLLFLDLDELDDLASRVADAQAMLAALAEDPSLRGLFGMLGRAVEARADGEALPGDMAGAMDAIAGTVEDQIAGRPGALSWRRLVDAGSGRDATRAFIIAQGRPPTGAQAMVDFVRQSASELDRAAIGDVTVRLTGSPALELEELQTVAQGTEIAGILSFVLVTLLLVWGLKSWRLIVAVLIPLVVGLVWTFAFAAVSIGQLNLISMAFAVLFIGLAVDFGIHFTLRFREALIDGDAPGAALGTAAEGIGRALTLSAVSATIGFVSFVPTAYRGLAELGIIAGGGMVVALFLNLTFTPALIAVLRADGPRVQRRPVTTPILAAIVERRYRMVLVLCVAAALGCAALAARVTFDVNPLNLQDPSNESVATFLDLADDSDTTPYIVNVLADDMATAEALADRLGDLPEVARAVTLADFVPREQDRKLAVIDDMALFLTPVMFAVPVGDPPDTAGRRAAAADLADALATVAGDPDDPALAAAAGRLEQALRAFDRQFGDGEAAWQELERRLLSGFERYLDDLGMALSAGPVSLETLPADLVSRWVAPDGRVRVELSPAENVAGPEAMRRFARAVQAHTQNATGAPVILTEGSQVVIDAFVIATSISIAAIGLLLLIILRHLGDVMLTLAPLVLAAVYTLAAAVVLGLSFNFANVIVLPLLFGLGVSSSIHMVMRRRRQGATAGELLRTSTPRAVTFSVLTTAASFGSLAVSPHRGMSSMGVLLTIAITFTLVSTLVILPSMMQALSAKRRGGTAP
ncbi:MAG: MMPL family transporter [Rhodospirillaceae bacterium]|nr:MMPL family transporter [Rhodospirillaceae bacterium]